MWLITGKSGVMSVPPGSVTTAQYYLKGTTKNTLATNFWKQQKTPQNKKPNKIILATNFHDTQMRSNFSLVWLLDTNWSSMKHGMGRSQSRKQAKISLYNEDYIHQKENMLANATLRPECKHFRSHRSPKEPLNYKVTTLHACNVQFCFTHKRIHSILL